MPQYLDPTVDVTFKKVFGEHINLVKSLLNALLPLPEGKEIVEAEYLSAENIPENPVKKYSIVDVKCRDNEGRYFIVEMQSYWSQTFFKRTLFNTTSIYSKQLEKADNFSKLKSVYALCLVDDERAFPQYEDYIQEYKFINTKNLEDQRNEIGLVFVILPKYKPTTKVDKKLKELWLKYLTQINGNTTEVESEMLENAEISEALNLLHRSALSDEEYAMYEKDRLEKITENSLKEERENDRKESIEQAKAEGMAKGLTEGREQGIAEGLAKGLTEGREQGIAEGIFNSALKMYNKNYSLETIADILDLNETQFEILKNKILK